MAVIIFCGFATQAAEKIKMNFKNEELTTIIEHYSKATGQKFIIDSTVRGKITLLNSNDVSSEEAFDQISEALAINGFAIIKNDETMTIKNARSAQRDNIPISTTLPSAKPQRMASWIINLKYASASELMNQLRLLTSSYGELSGYEKNNQIIVSDWTSNLQRISEIIKNVDVPQDLATAKLVAQHHKEHDARMAAKSHDKKPETKEKTEN